MKGRNRKTIALEGTLLLSVVAGELTALPREVPSITEAQLARLEKTFKSDVVATACAAGLAAFRRRGLLAPSPIHP